MTDPASLLQSRGAPLCLSFHKTELCILTTHLHRPVLNQYVHTLDEFQSYTRELFDLVQQGKIRLSVHGEYPLTTEGVRQTHKDISASLCIGFHLVPNCRTDNGRNAASRKTSGKLLVKTA